MLDATDLVLEGDHLRLKPHQDIIEEQLLITKDSLILINKVDLITDKDHAGETTIQLRDGTIRPAVLISVEKKINIDLFLSHLS